MTDAAADSLPDVVAASQKRIDELRRAGDPTTLLAAATAAADEIERLAGTGANDEERQALTAVKRFTFNAAADCWPGWSAPPKPTDSPTLLRARGLAQRSAGLVKQLGLGPLQEGTGTWLCGAFDLALGRYAEASSAFSVAREHYIAAKAPGLALLTEGYLAIARNVGADQTPPGTENLEQVLVRIDAGGFKDGAEWIAQLRTALEVFAQQ